MNLYNMTNYECFMRGIYGLFAMNAQAGLTLALALDRLFAIVKPASYRKWKAKSYLTFICAPATLYAIPMTMYGYFSSSRDLSVLVCMPPTAYAGLSRAVWTYSQVFISACVLLLYTWAQLSFWRKKKSSGFDGTMLIANRVFQSLAVVMILYSATWAFTFIMMLIILFLRSPTVQKTIELWLVWPVIINSASNVIIYWWRSNEFRKAFMRVLFVNDVKILKRSTVWSKGSRRRTIVGSIKPLTVLPHSDFEVRAHSSNTQ
ncbi:serpentine type 7TM GPCR chemoreceptor srsx domain-containing protein [Ditylenchus destructor]|nr:serpentine type 7TM GPCR chemoreceptor srsx domain-containing protein [Ditylenchus destructor]